MFSLRLSEGVEGRAALTTQPVFVSQTSNIAAGAAAACQVPVRILGYE